MSYKMDGVAAGTNVAAESQGMSLNIWLSSRAREVLELSFV